MSFRVRVRFRFGFGIGNEVALSAQLVLRSQDACVPFDSTFPVTVKL